MQASEKEAGKLIGGFGSWLTDGIDGGETTTARRDSY